MTKNPALDKIRAYFLPSFSPHSFFLPLLDLQQFTTYIYIFQPMWRKGEKVQKRESRKGKGKVQKDNDSHAQTIHTRPKNFEVFMQCHTATVFVFLFLTKVTRYRDVQVNHLDIHHARYGHSLNVSPCFFFVFGFNWSLGLWSG